MALVVQRRCICRGGRKAQRAESGVELHAGGKTAPDVSCATDPVPRQPMGRAAPRRSARGVQTLPLESVTSLRRCAARGGCEMQAEYVQVRAFWFIGAAADDIHPIPVDESLVLVPRTRAVARGGESCPGARGQVERVGVIEIVEAWYNYSRSREPAHYVNITLSHSTFCGER